MFRITFSFAILVLLSLTVFGQKTKPKPDFSGTWVLNKEMTFSDPEVRKKFQAFTLVLEQNVHDLKIKRTFFENGKEKTYIVTLYTDKRGETNLHPNGITEIKSKTFWKKNVIVSKSYKQNPSRKITFDHIVEKFKLVENQSQLIITRSVNTVYRNPGSYIPRNLNFDRKVKFVFTKKDI